VVPLLVGDGVLLISSHLTEGRYQTLVHERGVTVQSAAFVFVIVVIFKAGIELTDDLLTAR
jgi:hypothetical protein